MLSKLFLLSFAVFASTVPVTTATAQPVDCDVVKSSRIPYQLIFESDEIVQHVGLPKKSISQIYRDPSGTNTVRSSQFSLIGPKGMLIPAGTTTLLRTGAFTTQVLTRRGTTSTSIEYSEIDPKNFDYETKSATFTAKVINNLSNAISETRHIYSFIKRGTFVIGSCQFDTIHFKQETSSSDDQSRSTTNEYSPELEAILSYQTETRINGQVTRTSNMAVEMTTQFSSLR